MTFRRAPDMLPTDDRSRQAVPSSRSLASASLASENLSAKQSVTEVSSGRLDHSTLKYSLLGPSLLKAGQESVDQSKVCTLAGFARGNRQRRPSRKTTNCTCKVSDIIYNASKGSKYFDREVERDKILSSKIEQILAKKAKLEQLDFSRDLRLADALITQLESGRDLSQHMAHIDVDSFYAAVELLDRPHLASVPFAVGGGVLSTCNYVARKFGCRSGMASFIAKKLCPQLVVLKPDFAKYNAKAQEIRQVLAGYDPRFESASCDEAYLNITNYCAIHKMAPAEVVSQLRQEVAEKTKVTVSAGIAANMRLAKICSNMNKPNGQYCLPNDRTIIMEFMKDLPCRKVNGIGRALERELAAVGVKTCGDVFQLRMFLNRLFGEKAYNFLLRCYLGLGRIKVQPAGEYERKSVGTESTFNAISDPEKLREKLRWTAGELEKDLRRASCKGRTLVLKIKLDSFEVHTRQTVVERALISAGDLYERALAMLCKLEQESPGMKVRLLGLRCTHLVSTKKTDALAFFGVPTPPPGGTEAQRSTSGRKTEALDSGSEWEGWLDASEGLSEAESQQDAAFLVLRQEGQEDQQQPRRHGREITGNPASHGVGRLTAQDEQWQCPVCFRAQPADGRQFNNHIDSCLSRRAILEAVQESSSESHARAREPSTTSSGKRKARTRAEKKQGRHAVTAATSNDSRQKKICFETL